MSGSNAPDRPSVLAVDLGRLARGEDGAVGREPWRGSTPGVDRVGSWSGGALALALLWEAEVADPAGPAPLVIAVGECVRRGVPTAARASVASRAPLTGLLGDGQVGSDLGRRLASVTDALRLSGRVEGDGACLHLAPDGSIELLRRPELAGAPPREVHRALVGALGPCATLCVGPAGERRLPFASLAAGGDPPRLVGRGGLGAVMGALGLKALAVSAPEVEPVAGNGGSDELSASLMDSPRLVARAEGGTLELFGALAARGDLRALDHRAEVSGETARALAGEVRERARTRHGCRGCPTPCGWVFETSSGANQAAHFSATYALGLNLGLEGFEDALALLERCDAAAMDAREVGALLALACRAGEGGRLPGAPRFGDAESLHATLDELLEGRGAGAFLGGGVVEAARRLDLEEEPLVAKGAAARPDSDLAAVLGQCVAARGNDPMRTFPFLVGDGPDPERLAQLLDPLPLPRGAEDARNPAGKGRLVWWHENLTAAIDASGFCVFSAAALLADGLCDLDSLAERVAPDALRAEAGDGRASGLGAALLESGAAQVVLARDLNRRWGAPADQDEPPWAREVLAHPQMLAEYRALRGIDAGGSPTATTWRAFEAGRLPMDAGTLAPAGAGRAEEEPPPDIPGEVPGEVAAGCVRLRASGPLAEVLGGEVPLEGPLPATLLEVLERACDARPRARSWLLRDGRPSASVYRDGRRLAACAGVRDGDVLDLVVALSGG